jgi:predicted P-loop ATPase
MGAIVNSNVVQLPSWRNQLAKKRNGDPYADERNVAIALDGAAELSGMLQYDAFADQIRMLRPPPWDPYREVSREDWRPKQWSDADRIELQMWLQNQGLQVAKAAVVQDSVIAVAQRTQHHPVRQYLDSIAASWDGQPRIDAWLIDYLGAQDDERYLMQIGPKFLLGAVARIYEPGCQMDTILVLEGPQGLGKSSAVRVLFGSWCSDIAHDMANKDAAIMIQGVWCGELSELTALAKSQIEVIKAFISRRVDRYRPPYGRNAIERPRQTVFIATTNECEYLQDVTGGRRFWPVDCSKIDTDALEADRAQLWAEAVIRYRKGEKWHLDRNSEAMAFLQQEHRRLVTPMESEVLGYLDRMRGQGHSRLDMRTVLKDALGVDPQQVGTASGGIAKAVSRIMTANGWVRFKPTGRGENRVVLYQYTQDRDPNAAH